MTKDQYIHWKKTRGPVNTWDIKDCWAADKLIKHTALDAARVWIKANVHELVAPLFMTFLSVNFGSVDVDDFLQSINAYPDWM